jgi:hypothetical protein
VSERRDEISTTFWDNVEKTEDCWLWLRGVRSNTNPRKAYGVVRVNGRTRAATHVAWELTYGRPFPEGMLACHHCDNPRCVRPSHLFVGTARDNTHDALRKGRLNPHNAWKTHCPQGHPYDEVNTYINPNSGRRTCRACRNTWKREHLKAARQLSPAPLAPEREEA